MTNPTVLDWITAIGAVITPILLLVLSAMFAQSNARQEKRRQTEAALQDERVAIYNQILEPYIAIATPELLLHKEKRHRGKTSGEVAAEILTTARYKDAEFKLFLMGSDGVVKAYNELKRFMLSGKLDGSTEPTKTILALTAQFLLEIRKSVGYDNTKITARNAIDWMVKDADKYF